jgi:hypothetical protein
VQPLQFRFVNQSVNVADTTAAENLHHALSLRSEMRRKRRRVKWGRSGSQLLPIQNQAKAMLPIPPAALQRKWRRERRGP